MTARHRGAWRWVGSLATASVLSAAALVVLTSGAGQRAGAQATGDFAAPGSLSPATTSPPQPAAPKARDGIPPRWPAGNPPPPGSHLVFDGGFSGGSLNPSKWRTCYPWDSPSGCTNADNGELEWYLPQQVEASGGVLRLTATRDPVTASGHVYPYRSGMVTTHGRFDFTYGYVRFWARWPAGRGLWPGVWMLPSRLDPVPEVDIMEINNRQPGTVYENYHSPTHVVGGVVTGLRPGWHEFSLDWTPDSLTYSVDGTTGFVVTTQVPRTPMYLLVDLAVGGPFPGAPDGATRFPATLDVASLQVWQR